MEIIDPYDHVASNVLYIKENIPTNETMEEFEKEFLLGCNCMETCNGNTCDCILKSGAYYEQDKIHVKEIERPIYECNDSCKCRGYPCNNRTVQYGPRQDLLIKMSQNVKKGFGLFASKIIESGSFICEYAGEIISEKEAKSRLENNERNNLMNYVFCVREHYGEKVIKTFIDSSTFSNIGRYINHSCNPNCFLIPVRVQSFIPKLCIFSKKTVKENEEITYNYGVETIKYDLNSKLKDCLCLEDNCKKFMPFSNCN